MVCGKVTDITRVIEVLVYIAIIVGSCITIVIIVVTLGAVIVFVSIVGVVISQAVVVVVIHILLF
jgi:hypothetical protein